MPVLVPGPGAAVAPRDLGPGWHGWRCVGEASAMASGHDAPDHAHDPHGHDDHGHAHEAPSSFFVVPPMLVGLVVAIVLIALLGTDGNAAAWHSPF